MFLLSIPVCMTMLLAFLFELTAEEPDMRSLIYRTELAKVFFSVLYWFLLTMIFSNWLQTLKKFIGTVRKQQEKLKAGQRQVIYGGDKPGITKAKKDQINRFTLTKFTLSDAYELFLN
jgi:hypothetical protein